MAKKLGLVAIFGLTLFLVLIFSYLKINFHLSQTLTEKTENPVNQASQNHLSLGTNLSRIADWSTEMPFLDAFKSSRQWITQCLPEESDCCSSWNTNESEKLDLDEYGWVKTLPAPEDSSEYPRVGTLMFRDISRYPGGRYVVLYDGEGTIEYKFDARKIESASTLGRDVIDVKPSKRGIYLSVTTTDPHHTGNYIRNLHVVPEKYENTYDKEIFNPEFLNKIRKFKTLRFMDWMGTNNSQQSEWKNRPKTESYSYSYVEGGVPIEIMLELANRVKADPWFNMPHQATDDYIENFARMVKDSLDRSLKVYLEYSNEVWNTNFSQGDWVEQQGIAEWSNDRSSNYTKRINWHGKRTAQMCNIWKKVFGEQSDRVICVLGSQSANSWTATEALDCPLWEESPCTQHGIDAVAIAPYFGSYLGKKKNEPELVNWNVDRVFTEINQGGVLAGGYPGGAMQKSLDDTNKNLAITQTHNLQLLAYEGGQHLVGSGGVENNQKITDLLIATNRNPRMYQTYWNYLEKLQESGVILFNHWLDIGSYNKWGSWGTLENLNQEKAPKYNALIDFINSSN